MTVIQAPLDTGADVPDFDAPVRSWWRLPSAEGALPIAALVLIPVAIFAGAVVVTGHPLLLGDNLLQSYPLRVLVGRDYRHGQLPFWDPYIWSGTPLLAGLNAGAFYPTTFLFAVLPATGAWVITQVFASASVSVGTYVFMRDTGIRKAPSFLGALSFAFAGAIAAQGSVHMDMAEGFASLPWMLIALRRIIEDGRWRWTLLLGAAVACLVLAGAPEAILDVSILCLVYAVIRWSLQPSAWGRLLTRAVAGLAMGVGLSAVLWVPALRFIASSQRGSVSRTFAASYSFPARSLVLGISPFVQGGWSLLGEPHYLGLSNMPEVSFYVGLLPIVAALALAGRRWSAWLPHGERRTWFVLGAVGLVLAIGAKTPIDNVIWHIPYYGKQRDQGRNIVDVDFALCMLLAWWLDGGSRPEGVRTASETVAAGTVTAAAGALVVWVAVAPSSLWRDLETVAPAKADLGSILTASSISLALAAVALALTLGRHRWPRRGFLAAAAVLVVVDVGLFATGTDFAGSQAVPSTADPGPVLRLVADNLPAGSRYAVFDPDLFDTPGIVGAGEANMGILLDLPSVQGYGAVLWAAYSASTATHIRGGLAVGELGAGYFRSLGLQVMVSPAEEFLTPIAAMPVPGGATGLTPVTELAGTDPLLPGGTYLPPEENLPTVAPSGPLPALSPGRQDGWYFGTVLSPHTVALVLSRPSAGQRVRFGVVTPAGAVDWQSAQRLGQGAEVADLALPAGPAVGLVVQLLGGASLGPLRLAVGTAGHAYAVDGPLVTAMAPSAWRYVGEAEGFAVFRADSATQQAWVQSLGTYAVAAHLPADVTVLAAGTDSATIAVRTAKASLLVRSLAWDYGWSAAIVSGPAASADLATAASGASLTGASATTVRQVGVTQGVEIPPGLSIVRFSYEPSGWRRGLAVSGVTLAATVVGVALGVVLSRRRRRRRRPGPFSAL